MRFAFAGVVPDIASIVTWHHLANGSSLAITVRSANSLDEVSILMAYLGGSFSLLTGVNYAAEDLTTPPSNKPSIPST